MKYRAVMPYVELTDVAHARHVTDNPFDSTLPIAKPPPRHVQSGFGHVEHRDAWDVEVEQVVYQRGGPTPNVNHALSPTANRFRDQAPGHNGVRLVPANLIWRLRQVDVLPIFSVHDVASIVTDGHELFDTVRQSQIDCRTICR